MIGIEIHQKNMYWGNYKMYQKRHIHINIKYTKQYYRFIKNQLKQHLQDNHNYKAIIISNTSRTATKAQNEVETWLNIKNELNGDTLLIVGN